MRNDMRPAAGTPHLLAPGRRALAQVHDVALLDLDGVVYTGPVAIPGAVPALAAARAAGLRLAFVTNNASRSPSSVAEHLSSLGVPASAADVVTSAQAAASVIASRFPAGSPVLVAGALALRLALRERGLRPVSVAAERPVAVVQGFSPDLSYSLLAEAALAVRAGALYVASNADPTLPTARGLQPGNGSLLQVVITATGVRPVVAGKPEPPLHAEAVARTRARRPLVVGDRLDTDIEGAVRGGADSMLVLTGVSTSLDAVLAPRGQRPTYLAADLRGLLEAQLVVGPRGSAERGESDGSGRTGGMDASDGTDGTGPASGAFRCGGWEVRRLAGGGRLELTGDGRWIDGLRALCAGAWSAGQVLADQVRPALEVLGPAR